MAEVVLFHHVLGVTDGVRAFADELRAAGHVVHVPDLFDGRTFPDVEAGIAHAKEVGFEQLFESAMAEAQSLPAELVYGGMSLGVGPAQTLAQSRPGARGALLLYGAAPLGEWGIPDTWPAGVPAQVHVMEDDDLGDVDVARKLADDVDEVELFLYPGDRHLFADRSAPDWDEPAAQLLTQRVLEFLARV